MELSLIVSVYKNTAALKVVLDSLKEQTFKDFEIIISEDGNDRGVQSFLASYPFENPWIHLIQEDLGWRKNRALNRAILASNSEHLVFIDGDCVLHPRFMEMHRRFSGENRILAGKRIKLNEELSHRILHSSFRIKDLQHHLMKNFPRLRKMGFRFQEEGLFIDPDHLLGFITRLRKMSQLKGCNMSFTKKAILSINGFDEDYIRPAIGEDIDLVWRFEKAGYSLFSLRNLAVQYHLHHKENWSDQSENVQMLDEKRTSGQFVCRNGIQKDLI